MSAIAAAIGPKDTAAALAMLSDLEGRADLVELRLDLMESFDLEALAAAGPRLLVTNRARAEGGMAGGSRHERLRPLLEAIDLGCAYIDVEADLVELVPDRGATGLVVSQHDFSSTPPDLLARARHMETLGADVVKLAVMPIAPQDAIVPLELLDQARQPTVAIAMGPLGLVSRVAALRFENCAFTYATADGDRGTAPGQLSISQLRRDFRADSISPATALLGLFGPASKAMWLACRVSARLATAGVDGVCIPLAAQLNTPAALVRLGRLGFAGFWDVGRSCFAVRPDTDRTRAVDPEEAAAWFARLVGR